MNASSGEESSLSKKSSRRRPLQIIFAVLAVAFSGWGTALFMSSFTEEINGKYHFVSYGVDDSMSCILNGDQIASQTFGRGEIRIDITDKIQKGKNRLNCRVTDRDNGICYAWHFEITKDGKETVEKQKFSCCTESCRKNGPEVLNENYEFSI